jgi:preprotein translocase subunit SecG
MRKALIVLAFIFVVIGIPFAILPLGTLGVLPAGLSLVFGLLAFFKSPAGHKNVPKWLMILAGLLLVVIIAKAMVPDEVVKDTEFEQKKIESKQEDLKDLEQLEDL